MERTFRLSLKGDSTNLKDAKEVIQMSNIQQQIEANLQSARNDAMHKAIIQAVTEATTPDALKATLEESLKILKKSMPKPEVVIPDSVTKIILQEAKKAKKGLTLKDFTDKLHEQFADTQDVNSRVIGTLLKDNGVALEGGGPLGPRRFAA